MEYINFGKVVNVSASVPVTVNDTAYHIIIDFVPNSPEIFDSFHTDMGKILEWPDDYVLCNVSDIKELEDLKSKTVAEARYEWKDGGFALIYTMCDGSKKNARMDLSESIDATVISCGTVPKCSSCKNHRYYGKICGHMCYLPDSKCIIPNTFNIFPLTDEEAEGPACDKFVAKE